MRRQGGGGHQRTLRLLPRQLTEPLRAKVETIGWIGTRFGTMVAVRDTQQVPGEHRTVVGAAMYERMSAAMARVSSEPCEVSVQRSSVALMIREFRAAVAEANA